MLISARVGEEALRAAQTTYRSVLIFWYMESKDPGHIHHTLPTASQPREICTHQRVNTHTPIRPLMIHHSRSSLLSSGAPFANTEGVAILAESLRWVHIEPAWLLELFCWSLNIHFRPVGESWLSFWTQEVVQGERCIFSEKRREHISIHRVNYPNA